MKSLVLVLTILVTIIGVLSKDIPSNENNFNAEELDLLDSQYPALLDLDRKNVKRCWKKDGTICCKTKGKPGSIKCKPNSCKNNQALVLTGGDTDLARFDSSELVSYLGVCSSPNIPSLPEAITSGESTWLEKSVMFCGGSNQWLGKEDELKETLDTCWQLNPKDSTPTWNPSSPMNVKRGWFSLNNINGGEAVAAGGYDGTSIWDTIEKYSDGAWSMTGITMKQPLYGHCAVHYTRGNKSYLMIIGGSCSEDGTGTSEVTRINLKNGGVDVLPSGDLPELVLHACVIDCAKENIYVSGGRKDDGDASSGVYKYNLKQNNGFVEQSNLNNPRWGHIMGLTSKGQMVVAGGYDHATETYLTSVESNIGGGIIWNEVSPGLSEAREYAAMASVPAFAFGCTG